METERRTIERDECLYVAASSPDAARRFFGLPADTEVRCDHVDRNGRTVYAVAVEVPR